MATRTGSDTLKRLAVDASELGEVIDTSIGGDMPGHLSDIFESETGESDTVGESRRKHAEAVEEFFNMAVEELAALRTRAEINAIERAADLILEGESRGGRVHVTGIGKSEHIARYVASLLSSTGTPSYFLHATECIHGSAGQVCPSDVIIAISNSGNTPELLSAIEVLSKLGIKIIAVSGKLQSPLAELSDVVLYAGVDNEGGALNLVPRASILAKIYVLCSLSVALESHKGLTREQYAQWHPGGALGRLARGE
jgi:D-arabinose 5-phosphate isomerase GutQ